MTRMKFLAAALAVGLMLPAMANAAILIDDFSSIGGLGLPTGLFDGTINATPEVLNNGATGLSPYTNRDASVNLVAGSGAQLFVAAGRFEFNPTSDGVGTAILTYNGVGAQDLTAMGADSFNLVFVTHDDNMGTEPLPVTVTVSDGTNSSTFTTNFLGIGTLTIPYSSLVGTANLTAITEITFTFAPPDIAHDFSIDFLGTAATVPEPSSFVLLSLGGFGLILWTRRKRASELQRS